jgi:hypothetical protein
MLKHSTFSNNYLNHRLDRENSESPEIHGTLAVSPKKQPVKPLVVCRSNMRTWWEAGWKQKK